MADEKVLIKEATVKGTKDEEKVVITDAIVKGTKQQTPSTPLPARTTEQEDITTSGQRKINLIWEVTQAVIAIIVVLVNMVAALFNVFKSRDIDVPMILSSSLFLIIGFYFSRTNHQAIGGIGSKINEQQQYRGR